ncbi:uncharacterized protein LOC117317025 [Pecten maximus]|uniref:uncharacterized protein LOC117315338 n=1 Tax=Pecten maximus TaxID=6579 RepID=UPI0014583CAD|nr:uncharacterized protein LOC117315338 [Pecten maximus]XP_033727699.1 uncharacterized protein LOC117317025 [Pecten maximus]
MSRVLDTHNFAGKRQGSQGAEEMDLQIEVESEEMRDFLKQEEWKSGDRCMVSGCPVSKSFVRGMAYVDHWAKVHLPQTYLYQCVRCGQKWALRTRATRHSRTVHRTEDLPRRLTVPNRHYVDPGAVSPPPGLQPPNNQAPPSPRTPEPVQEAVQRPNVETRPWRLVEMGPRQPSTLWALALRCSRRILKANREKRAKERGLMVETSLVDYLHLIHEEN